MHWHNNAGVTIVIISRLLPLVRSGMESPDKNHAGYYRADRSHDILDIKAAGRTSLLCDASLRVALLH